MPAVKTTPDLTQAPESQSACRGHVGCSTQRCSWTCFSEHLHSELVLTAACCLCAENMTRYNAAGWRRLQLHE